MDLAKEPFTLKQMGKGARLFSSSSVPHEKGVDVEVDSLIMAIFDENGGCDLGEPGSIVTLNARRYEVMPDNWKTSLCKQLAFRCKGRQETPANLILPKGQNPLESYPFSLWAMRIEVATVTRCLRGLEAMRQDFHHFKSSWSTDAKQLRVDGNVQPEDIPKRLLEPVRAAYWTTEEYNHAGNHKQVTATTV